MQRIFAFVSCSLALVSCAGIDIPGDEANPAWVNARIAAEGEGHSAPATIPQHTLEPGAEQVMDHEAMALLRKREMLNALADEANRTDTVPPEDFVAEGQDRTSPPQD